MLFVFLLAGTFCYSYSENPVRLVLWHSDGSQTRVELYTRPQVKISTDSVWVTSPVATLKYACSDVLRFTYENVPTGISSVQQKAKDFQVSNGRIYFSGKAKSSQVHLYSIDGKEQPINVTVTDEGLCMPLSQVQSGTYLLNVNGKTCKFEKK